MMSSSIRMQREAVQSLHLATNNNNNTSQQPSTSGGVSGGAHHGNSSTVTTSTTTALPAGISGGDAVRRRNSHHHSQHQSSDHKIVAGPVLAVLPDKLGSSSHLIQSVNAPNSSTINSSNVMNNNNNSNNISNNNTNNHMNVNHLHHSSPVSTHSGSSPIAEQHNSTVIVEATPPRRVGSALNFVRSTVPPASGGASPIHSNTNNNNNNNNINSTTVPSPVEGSRSSPHGVLPTTKVTPPNSQRATAQAPFSSSTISPPPRHRHRHPHHDSDSGGGGADLFSSSSSSGKGHHAGTVEEEFPVTSLSFSSSSVGMMPTSTPHRAQGGHHPPHHRGHYHPHHPNDRSPVEIGGKSAFGGGESRPPEQGVQVDAVCSSTQGSTLSSSTATTVLQDEDTAYLESQNVTELVAQLYQSVVSEQPEEPIQFIIEQLRHPRGGSGDEHDNENENENTSTLLRGERRRQPSLHSSVTAADNGNTDSPSQPAHHHHHHGGTIANKTTSPLALRKSATSMQTTPTTNTTTNSNNNNNSSATPPPPISLMGASTSSAASTPLLTSSSSPAPSAMSPALLGPATTTTVSKPKNTATPPPEPVRLSPCPPKVTSPSAKPQLKHHKKKTAGQVVVPVRPPSPVVTLSMSGPISVPRTRPSSHHTTNTTPQHLHHTDGVLSTNNTRPTLSPLSDVIKSPSPESDSEDDQDNSTTVTQTVSWDTRHSSSYTSVTETSPSPTHTAATTATTLTMSHPTTTSYSPSNGLPSREMTRSPIQMPVPRSPQKPAQSQPHTQPVIITQNTTTATDRTGSSVSSPPPTEEAGRRRSKPTPVVLQLEDVEENYTANKNNATITPTATRTTVTLSAPTPHEAVKAREEDIKSHPVTPPKPPNKKLSPASDSKKKPVERDHPHQNNEMAPSSSSQGCSTTKEQSENSSTCSSRTRTPAKANLTMKKSGSGSGEDGATLLTGPPTPSVSPSPPLSSSPPPIHVLSIPECSTQSTPPPPHPVVAVAAGSGALLPTSPVVVHRRTEGGNAIATANSSGEEQKKAEAMVPSGSATAGTESKPPLTLVLAPGPEESERLLASQTNTTTTPNTASPHQKPPRPVSNGLGGRSRQRSSNANSIAHSFVNALQRLDSFDPQQKISDAEELQRQCEAVNSSSNGGAPPLPASISTSTPHMLLSDLIGGLESPPPPSACGGGCNSSMGSLGLRASSAPRTTFSAGGGAGGLMSSQRMNSMMRIPSFNSSSRSWVIDNKGELRSSSSDLSVFSCGSVDVQEFLTDFKQAKVQCLKEKQQLISLDDLVMILDNVNVPLPDITLLSDLFDELRLPPRGVPMVLEKPQAPPPPPINNTNNTNNNSGSVSNGINSNSNINGNSVNSVLNASQKKHNNPTSTAPPPPPPPMIPSNPTTLPTSNSGTTGSGSSKPSSQKSNEVRGPLIRPSCADEYSASSGVHHNNLRNNANSNNTSHNNNNNANAGGGGGGGTLSTSASFPVVQMTDGGVTKPLAPSSSHSTMSTDYPTTGGNGGSNMNAMVSSGAGGARLTPNNGGAGGGVAARSLGIGGSSSPLWVTLDDAALVEEEEDPGDGTEGEERVEFQTFLARMAFMIHGRYPQEVIRSVFYAMVEDMDRGRIRVSVKGKDWLDSTFTAFPLYGGVSTASLDKADMAQFGVVGSGGGAGGASHAPRESTDGTVRAGGGLPPLYSHTPISPSSPVVLSSACSSPPTASSPDPMATTTSPGVAESVLRPNILSSIPTTGPRAAVDMGNANHHPSNSNSGDTASGGLDELGEATATATNFLHLSRTMPLYLCVMDGIYRRLGMRQFTGVHVQQALRAAHLPDDDLQWECHVNDFVAVVQALTQIVQPLTTTSTMSGGFAMASCAGGQASSPYLWPTAASSATSSRSGGRPPTQNFTSSFL